MTANAAANAAANFAATRAGKLKHRWILTLESSGKRRRLCCPTAYRCSVQMEHRSETHASSERRNLAKKRECPRRRSERVILINCSNVRNQPSPSAVPRETRAWNPANGLPTCTEPVKIRQTAPYFSLLRVLTIDDPTKQMGSHFPMFDLKLRSISRLTVGTCSSRSGNVESPRKLEHHVSRETFHLC